MENNLIIKCCVSSCNSNLVEGGSTQFFSLPKAMDENLTAKRRLAWLSAIGEPDLDKLINPMICSKHFHRGKPSNLGDTCHIDWVPTLHLNKILCIKIEEPEMNETDEMQFEAPDFLDPIGDFQENSTPQYILPTIDNDEATVNGTAAHSSALASVATTPKTIEPSKTQALHPKPPTVQPSSSQNKRKIEQPAAQSPLKKIAPTIIATKLTTSSPSLISAVSSAKPASAANPRFSVAVARTAPTVTIPLSTLTATTSNSRTTVSSAGSSRPIAFSTSNLPTKSAVNPVPRTPTVGGLVKPAEWVQVDPTNFKPICSCNSAAQVEHLKTELLEKYRAIEKLRVELEVEKANVVQVSEREVKIRYEMDKMMKKMDKSTMVSQLRDSDGLTKFYTGLRSWSLFTSVYNLCEPIYRQQSGNHDTVITAMEQLVLTLMKLRLALHTRDLAYRFNISHSTVAHSFQRWIRILYSKLPSLYMTREDPRPVSHKFIKYFDQSVSIIDTFNVAADNDKGAVHFVVSITPQVAFPQGTFSYISPDYEAKSDFPVASSRHVAIGEDPELRTMFLPKNTLLARRGFFISEELALDEPDRITPAFQGVRTPLTEQELDQSSRVTHVRKPVNRVVEHLKQTFTILNTKFSEIDLREDHDAEDDVSTASKIAAVCCCLHNLSVET